MSSSLDTSQGNGTLGKWTLLAMGVGCTIGAGVFSLVGQAIGITGHSLWLAFGLAIILGFFYNVPMLFASGSLIMDGGPYALISTILGKKYAGMYVVSFFLYFPTVAIYAISLGIYVHSVIPGLPVNVVAIIALTTFYIVNLFGMDTLSKFQNMMTAALVVGVATFILIGLGHIDFTLLSSVSNPDFLANGPKGLFQATCLLSFCTYCQYYLMFFSRHAKNPKKDIAFGMLGTTIVIVFVYLGVSVVASGVLPIEAVANQPLTYVAKKILASPIFVFFIICGPFMALATTINSVYAAYVQPLYSATQDGWFPESFAATNKKGSPWKILTICWASSMLPIVLGWDVSTIANTYLLTDLILGVFLVVSIAQIPKKYPGAWANREFGRKIPTWIFYVSVGLAGLVQCIIIYNSITSIKLYIVVITIIAFTTGVVYAIKKEKDHNVKSPMLDLSLETND
ncbi:APC family permease [Desulfoluna spongiiphila]|nr:APC family permease [Desulfoluna spongiiphila]